MEKEKGRGRKGGNYVQGGWGGGGAEEEEQWP